jgi:hypothetical protein
MSLTKVSYSMIQAAPINVADYGAIGDGTTNDTAAFVAAFAALQALGGGQITGGQGKNYAIAAPIGGTLITLTSCSNINIDFSMCKITDTTTYTGSQTSTFFSFVTCNKIDLSANVVSQQSVTLSPTSVNSRGLIFVILTQGGSQLNVNLNMIGGFEVINAIKAFNDPVSYQFSGITGTIKAYGIYYPFIGAFSGCNVDLILEAENCNRPFFIYGVSHNKLRLYTKNMQGTALIKAYNGYGCQNVDVDWTDINSTSNLPAAPRLAIEWGDSTAAIHSDIRINVNWKNPSASPWGNSLGFAKYSDGGGTPDFTGRGHRLYGFKLTGFSDNSGTAVSHVNWEAGGFDTSGTADLMTGYEIGPFIALGNNNAMSWSMFALGTAVFNSVTTQQNIYTSNGSQGRVMFNNCQANAYTGASNVTDQHAYFYSNIASDPNTSPQAYNVSKRFVETQINSAGYVTGRTTQTESNSRIGNLTVSQNLFKLYPVSGNSFMLTLRYYLTGDQAETNPLLKDETYGIKSFTAFLDSSGNWTLQTAVANMVAERTLNTAAVLTVTLVNGTSAGAFIAVSATNYSGVSAMGSFELSTSTGQPFIALDPV